MDVQGLILTLCAHVCAQIKVPQQLLEAEVEDYLREIGCLKALSHPNIVPILGVVSTTNQVCTAKAWTLVC